MVLCKTKVTHCKLSFCSKYEDGGGINIKFVHKNSVVCIRNEECAIIFFVKVYSFGSLLSLP